MAEKVRAVGYRKALPISDPASLEAYRANGGYRALERAFVLVPWLQVDPDATLPGIGRVDGLPDAAANVRRYPAEALS